MLLVKVRFGDLVTLPSPLAFGVLSSPRESVCDRDIRFFLKGWAGSCCLTSASTSEDEPWNDT